MKITFDTVEEYDSAWTAAHSGILYWKKMKQACQGKIKFYVSADDTPPYSIEECEELMKDAARFLKAIEDSTHPVEEYDEATDNHTHKIVEGEEYYSSIVYKTLKGEVEV